MATYGANSSLIANGFDLHNYITDVEISESIKELETTVLGSGNDKTFIQGTGEATMSANGLFDGDADLVNDQIETNLRTVANIWTMFAGGDTMGNYGRAFTGIITSYNVSETVDDLIKIALSARSNTNVDLIRSLQPMATIATTTSTTGVDHGAATLLGGYAYIQAEAVTGTVDVIIEDSADNLAWSTIATATPVDTDLSAQKLTIAGTIRQFTRCTITIGGGESLTVQISLCRL